MLESGSHGLLLAETSNLKVQTSSAGVAWELRTIKHAEVGSEIDPTPRAVNGTIVRVNSDVFSHRPSSSAFLYSTRLITSDPLPPLPPPPLALPLPLPPTLIMAWFLLTPAFGVVCLYSSLWRRHDVKD